VSTWRNRIVRTGSARVEELLFNPLNWRIHPEEQQAAMRAALEELGWIQSIVINIRPDGAEVMIDGHMRVLLADRHDELEVPATWVSLTLEEETKALLTLDPIGALAGRDKGNLQALLEQTSTGSAALQALLSKEAERAGLIPKDESEPSQKAPRSTPQTCPACGHEFQALTN
jgi:hypothetical protein